MCVSYAAQTHCLFGAALVPLGVISNSISQILPLQHKAR